MVKARDAAILGRLRQGPASAEQLVEVMPIEDGQTPAERIDECARVVRRFQVKKVIVAHEQGFALA